MCSNCWTHASLKITLARELVVRSEEVVVVGAGIGGLVCAIELARIGLCVTVIERAAHAGGKMREVDVGSVRMDAGPTVLTMRWVFDEIFAAAGSSLEAHLTLRQAEILARHAWSASERLDLFADIERSAEAIGDFAGAREAAGFRNFSNEARRIYDTLKDSFLTTQKTGPVGLTRAILAQRGDVTAIRPFDTMWRALSAHFLDPRLRQLFGRYATYCGSSPFAAPATLMLVAHVEQAGVWLVEGGMQRLAEALERLAVSLGVRFRYNAHVEAIEVGRAGARKRDRCRWRAAKRGLGCHERRRRRLGRRGVRTGLRPGGRPSSSALPLALGGDLGAGGAHRGLPSVPPQRVLFR